MNASDVPRSARARTRRIWRWLLAGTALCLGGAMLAAYNLVTLPRDAAALRDELSASLSGSARTQVQVTAGPILLTLARTAISFFDGVPPEARVALRAVRNASVGVYQLREKVSPTEQSKMFLAADEVMRDRGWTRVVGVKNPDSLVMVYLPEGEHGGSTERVCVAVCSEEHLIVVSGKVHMDRLVDLAVHQGLLARR